MLASSCRSWRRHLTLAVPALAVLAVGCGPAGTADPGTGPPPPPDDDPVEPEAAFYLLDGADLRSETWLEDYGHYALFVCDPSFHANQIAQIRNDVPDATILAYTNAQDVMIHQYVGNPYFDDLTAAFDSSYCIRDLTTDTVVRSPYGSPMYIMSRSAADALVGFHRDRTMTVDWDGLYIDQCNNEYPQWRKDLIAEESTSFDIDFDGQPDAIFHIASQYGTWRPYFTQQLRQELGSDVVMVGNAGGALGDPELNGITLEDVGTRFTREEAESHFEEQRSVGYAPFVGIAWAIEGGTLIESRTVALDTEGVLFGVVRGGAAQ